MKIGDLVEQLRYLDSEMEVNATITRWRLLSDEEAAKCRLPNGKWKSGTLCCKATNRPIEIISIPLEWRDRAMRCADAIRGGASVNQTRQSVGLDPIPAAGR